MGKASDINIKKVAKLANLPLTSEEEHTFQDQLVKVLDYIELLEKADTSSVEPTYNVSDSKNMLREDEVKESLTQDETLANASNKKDGFFTTKGVFED